MTTKIFNNTVLYKDDLLFYATSLWSHQPNQCSDPSLQFDDSFDYNQPSDPFLQKYERKLSASSFQRSQPVIGILTMEFWDPDQMKGDFEFDQFIWEHNVNFVHYAGSWAYAVNFDITTQSLNELLPQLNGFYFTGGATKLFDDDTGEPTQYYQTAKRIFEYSKLMKDSEGIEWPIFGICQGFEVLNLLANEDKADTLSNVTIYSESRSLDFKEDAVDNSQMFQDFPVALKSRMANENLALHAHDYVITMDTYEESESLNSFYKVLASDTFQGIEFAVAIESKDYPISGVMFHPETQTIRTMGGDDSALKGKVNNEVTDSINYYFSEHLMKQAQKNLSTHYFDDKETAIRNTMKEQARQQMTGLTKMYGSLILTYGSY